MNKALDLVQMRKLLQRGIDNGLWTMEDLDKPPPGYVQQYADWKGVTLANLSRFERGPSDGGKVASEVHKHPAYRDFTAERLEREASQSNILNL